jgi:hypothetical protein
VTPRCARILLALFAVTAAFALCARPPAASAFNPVKPLCKAAGLVSGLVGKVCAVVGAPGRIVDAGKKLAKGHLGAAAKSLLGDGASAATKAVGLAAVGAWVIGGASFALRETAKVLSTTTSPRLTSTWFSSAYWRMAAIAALLTLPFLCAAAVQAIMRSDLALLARAAFGYLPLSMLAVGIAAPLTTLLLAASDQMSSVVSAAAGDAGGHFLESAGLRIVGLAAVTRSPFIGFFVGLFTVAGALTLWLELLIREAAVYVIVLMLPVVFAALVWPARRIWAIRAAELLVALILSKFAIVAVLALGGAALSHGLGSGVAGLLAGLVLVLLGAFAPWALLRLLPLHELASGAVGGLRAEARPAVRAAQWSEAVASDGDHWMQSLHARMRRDADETPGLAAGRSAGRGELEQLAGDGKRSSGSGSGSGSDADADGSDPSPDAGTAGHTSDRPSGSAEQRTAGAAGDPTPANANASAEHSPEIESDSPAGEPALPVLQLGLDHAWFRPQSPDEARPGAHWSLPEPTADSSQTDPGAQDTADDHDELPPRQEPENRL